MLHRGLLGRNRCNTYNTDHRSLVHLNCSATSHGGGLLKFLQDFTKVRGDNTLTSLTTAAICPSFITASVTKSVSDPPAKYSITT